MLTVNERLKHVPSHMMTKNELKVVQLNLFRAPSLMPTLFTGFDRGTNERADVVWQTLDGADLNVMWGEFQRTLDIRRTQHENLVNYFTYRVTNAVEQVRYPASDDFELASEYGEPKGVRLPPPINIGYSFQWYDIGLRYTWQSVINMDQAQVEALHNDVLESDSRLVMTQVLRAMLNSVNEVSSVRNIPINVVRFWNADGVVPPYFKTYTFAGSHNHYLTSGTAALTNASTSLPAIETHLYHHGYSIQNGYTFALFVNRQEGDILRAARVVNGWKYDFIPSGNVGGAVILPASLGIVGAPASPDVGALATQRIGTYGPFHVIEEDYIPAGYVIALASRGAENLGNPVGIREHANPSARGLQLIPGDSNYPLKDSFYRRGIGAGVRQRGGGVVMQMTVSGSYTIPAAYV